MIATARVWFQPSTSQRYRWLACQKLQLSLQCDFGRRYEHHTELTLDLRFSLRCLWRMPSSWMWRRVGLVRIDVSKEPSQPTLPSLINFLRAHFPSLFLHNVLFRTVVQSTWQLLTLFLAREFFLPEEEGDTFLRNVSSRKTHMAPLPIRRLFELTFFVSSSLNPSTRVNVRLILARVLTKGKTNKEINVYCLFRWA
jgi:hypothetical protein